MSNLAPICKITTSNDILTLPDNSFIIDLSTSYDPNLKGQIKLYALRYTGGGTAPTITKRSDGKSFRVVASAAESYSFEGKVTDARGATGTAIITVVVNSGAINTRNGASGPTITGPAILYDMFGRKTCTRTSTTLDTYKGGGSRELDKYLAEDDVMVFWNLNMSDVKKDSLGNKIPNPFPTNMTNYKAKLEPVLIYYKDHPKKALIKPVCENEPTTKAFYSGPMSNYLAELKVFVTMCRKYGYDPVDGGVHVEVVNGADSTQAEGKAAEVRELLLGYANIDLWAVNLHTSNEADKATYPVGAVENAVGIIRTVTGHSAVSNEWHVQFLATPDTLTNIANQFKGKVLAQCYISGTGTDPDKNKHLNNLNVLTEYGDAYKAVCLP